MRKRMLMFVLVLMGILTGTLVQEAQSFPYCSPLCLDPELTCCIPCWYQPGRGCVCGQYCVPEE